MKSRGAEPVKIKSAEKDQLIAELRQQLYDLKSQERDYRGVNEEILNQENRYKVLSDDKVRHDMESRARLDRDMDEIADLRRQVDDIKYLLQDKQKQHYDLNDEVVRTRRLLEEKHYESARLNDESSKKGDSNLDLRGHQEGLEKELDQLKMQRAENWREINRLKDQNDMKAKESIDKTERLKALDYDLSRTQARIDDNQKQIDAKNYDLRNKQLILEDTQKEIARARDLNGRIAQDNGLLRKEIDKQLGEAYELRKEVDYQLQRNQDCAAQLRDQDLRSKDKDEQAYLLRKELDNQRFTNSQMRESCGDMSAEKEALEKHAAVLQAQNNDLQRELDKFVETDEQVRNQLDRKGRVYGLRNQNDHQLQQSYLRIEDARSRSPPRKSPSKW